MASRFMTRMLPARASAGSLDQVLQMDVAMGLEGGACRHEAKKAVA